MAYRILSVDDDAGLTRLLKRLLGLEGYEVREVNDPSKALEAAQEFRPHLIILDYEMGTLSGAAVAWQIAEDEQLNGTRVILCSGHVESEFAHALPPMPMVIAHKPIKPAEIVSLVKQNLAGVEE